MMQGSAMYLEQFAAARDKRFPDSRDGLTYTTNTVSQR